ncbi:MAG TPA: Clp protease N-terminal domain-containing protein, partial [Gemmatimonadales bacterium]|nr:Clp protease N-terminal domain-containing protein [Gemmatimonadales bacterium]
MNPRTLSAYAQRALENARAEAVRLGHDAIGAEHIVLGLLRGDGTASALFGRLGVPPGLVEQRLEASGRRRANRGPGEQLAYTSHAKRLIELASKEAREAGGVLSAEHLLLAALHEPRGALVKILAEAGVSADRAQAA